MSTEPTLVSLLLLLTLLSLRVSQLRLRYRISHGDGGHKDLLLATRAHGNALEQSLIYVVLILAYDLLLSRLQGPLPAAPDVWVAASNIAYVSARVVQPVALFTRRLRLRQCAHIASLLLQWVVAIRLLIATAT